MKDKVKQCRYDRPVVVVLLLAAYAVSYLIGAEWRVSDVVKHMEHAVLFSPPEANTAVSQAQVEPEALAQVEPEAESVQAEPDPIDPVATARTNTNTNTYTYTNTYKHAWPQQDDLLHRLLTTNNNDTHRIDVDQTATDGDTHYTWNGIRCESPPKNLATIVTAYYDVPSKHPMQQYEAWFQNILAATDPMVIFVAPDNDYKSWWPFVEERRRHAPTLLVSLSFKNLTSSKVFSEDFWHAYVLPRDKAKRRRMGSEVYNIWNEKIVLMREVAMANPFDTETFYWVDAGYYRKKGNNLNYKTIVRNNITDKGVDPNTQLVYQMIFGYPRYEVAGGAWGGTSRAIQVHHDHYWRTFWYLLLYSNTECIGYEQRVMVWMCRSFPKLCVINQSSNWFAMGQQFLRIPHFDFLQNEVTIPSDNRTTLPPLTEAFDKPFPRESVIGLLDEIPAGQLSLASQMNYTDVSRRRRRRRRRN